MTAKEKKENLQPETKNIDDGSFDLEESLKNSKTSYLAKEYENILHRENQTQEMMKKDASLVKKLVY